MKRTDQHNCSTCQHYNESMDGECLKPESRRFQQYVGPKLVCDLWEVAQQEWRVWVQLGFSLAGGHFIEDITPYDCPQKLGYHQATVTLIRKKAER